MHTVYNFGQEISGKRPLGRLRYIPDGNIKVGLTETGCEGGNCIKLAQ